MKRRKARAGDPGATPKLEIASLIDISFLLLIYFLATSTLVPRESDIHMRMPTGAGQTRLNDVFAPMLITVDAQGAIHIGSGAARERLDVNADERDVPMLARHLTTYAGAARSAGSSPVVFLHAEDGARQQRVVDVLNTLTDVGIRHVAFMDLL